MSRSISARPPESLTATSHAAGTPLPRSGASPAPTGSASPRGARSGWVGTKLLPSPRRARSRSSAPSAVTTSSSSSRRNVRTARASPRPSNTAAVPPTRLASAPTIASRPRSESTIRCRRSCAAIERCRSAYCSLTRRVNACSVSAMNGSSYGTSNSGKPRSRAASTSALGTVSCVNPVPRPTPASPWSARVAMKSRWRLAVSSARPVVSSSSPPDSHGVGSSSSEMCTQRTGTSRFASPASTSTSRSPSTSRTVSTPAPSAVQHPARRLLEDGPQDRFHLLELVGPGDQRRRELEDGVAAVVGAADQAALEELARQLAPQERLGLLVGEGLLRLAVLDELERPEVAGPAHVADDLDVAQRLEHVAEGRLVLAHVLEQALVLEHVEVGHRDGGAHRVPAPRDAVGEGVRALEERLDDRVGRDDRAHRGVRAREALGRRDDVRLVAVLLGAEVVAEAAERADDLVGDHQDVVLVADLADALEVALGRREAAAGVLDRLHDHGGDRLGALELDAVRDRLGEVLGAVAGRQAVEVRVRDVATAGGERLERLAQRGDAGRAQCAHRRAVVGDLAGDDLVLVRVAPELVVLPRELERALDGLAAARGEEDAVEVAGGDRREARRELDRRRVGVGTGREEAEVLGLVGARLADPGAAVADVHAEQRAEAVEVLVAVLVPDVAAVALDDDRDLRALAVRAHPAEVHPEMALGEVLKGALGRYGLGRGHAVLHFVSELIGSYNANGCRTMVASLDVPVRCPVRRKAGAEAGAAATGDGLEDGRGRPGEGRAQAAEAARSAERTGAGVSAEATTTSTKAMPWMAIPSAVPGIGSPKTMMPPAMPAMFAAVPVMAMTSTASPSCRLRAEA